VSAEKNDKIERLMDSLNRSIKEAQAMSFITRDLRLQQEARDNLRLLYRRLGRWKKKFIDQEDEDFCQHDIVA
jgi:hypothetical protein